MFLGLLEKVRREIRLIKDVVAFHDRVRNDLAAEERSGDQDVLTRLRSQQPNRPAWQIYDHCAALTRLYAVYATFVDELVGEYLALLPKLYGEYEELPQAVLRQHRNGTAQILLKLGDSGPYRDLRESDVIG